MMDKVINILALESENKDTENQGKGNDYEDVRYPESKNKDILSMPLFTSLYICNCNSLIVRLLRNLQLSLTLPTKYSSLLFDH